MNQSVVLNVIPPRTLEYRMNSTPPGPPDWQRISAALDQGLDLSAAERETWLTELDRSDPILASRLRELFIQHERLEDSGFLNASASNLLSRTGPVPPAT